MSVAPEPNSFAVCQFCQSLDSANVVQPAVALHAAAAAAMHQASVLTKGQHTSWFRDIVAAVVVRGVARTHARVARVARRRGAKVRARVLGRAAREGKATWGRAVVTAHVASSGSPPLPLPMWYSTYCVVPSPCGMVSVIALWLHTPVAIDVCSYGPCALAAVATMMYEFFTQLVSPQLRSNTEATRRQLPSPICES